LAAAFFAVVTWTSYARWANFEYRTFDLAYYIQALWQLIHGRFQVSVENVPLLGNHVEPIVFLFAPLFAVIRHPMLFVVVQNAALAAMAPIGYQIAKRLGFDGKRACLLAATLLLTPAAGYIALHEFHPEALSAPLILLMLDARLARSLGRHWLWFLAVLACKENMALLLAAYCVVLAIAERSRGWLELRRWYLWPLVVAILWLALCSFVITPAFNSGNIDYLSLYDRLGKSAGDILRNAVTQPQLIGRAFLYSFTHGNLFWALLLPFLGLPLLRPRWILIAAPILLQHLLSWRSSEWVIYFHYAAPLLPLFWIAAVEAIAPAQTDAAIEGAAPSAPNGTRPAFAGLRHSSLRLSLQKNYLPWLLLAASVIAQAWLGPAAAIASDATRWVPGHSERARKNAFIAQISAKASVVAPLPYLSHLATREKLYSLHFILKGLKTLSRADYQPPPATDFVLIDYLDSATFDPSSGYYHPEMRTVDGRVVPSSDRLLHDFLRRASWQTDCRDELTLLAQGRKRNEPAFSNPGKVFEMGTHTRLVSINKSGDLLSQRQSLEVRLAWTFEGEREVFPWMLVRLTHDQSGRSLVLTRGLCAPEASDGTCTETWHITSTRGLPAGDYLAEAIFIDNSKRAWFEATGGGGTEATLLTSPVPLGRIKVE
jgi:uncharacterized membrane protein